MALSFDQAFYAILVTVVSFFLVRYINRNDKKLDIFIKLVTELHSDLKVVIANFDNKNINCSALHQIINHNFEKLDDTVVKLEIELTKIKK